MLTDVDKEFDTPEVDENGEPIEVIEIEEVFGDVNNQEPIEKDNYESNVKQEYEGNDILKEVTVQASENYYNAKGQLVDIFTSILEKGEIKAEDNVNIEQLKEQYSEAYTYIKKNVEVGQKKTLEKRLEELKENMVGATTNDILNILTENGTRCWLYKDDDNNVLIDGTSIPELTVLVNKLNLIATGGDSESELSLTPEFVSLMARDLDDDIQAKLEITKESILQTVSGKYATSSEVEEYRSEAEQTARKFSWLVKSGTYEGNMELTDRMYSLMTEKVLISAKNIELNGSININYGLFKVSTSGNTQIGGSSAVYADGYLRAQCEITSNGTIYSCSTTKSNEYTKITEGRVSVYTGGYFTFIGANGIKTNDELVLACDNMLLDYTENSPGRIRFRRSGDTYYFDPHISGQTRNGSSTNPWNIVYSQNGTSTGSDRNLKENIKYLNYDEINESADITYDITTKDCLNFLMKDYLLSIYNYIGDNKEKLSAVAQDVIYNADGTVNKVGNLVVDCEESVENGSLLNMNQTQLLNVVIGGMQGMYKELKQELEEIRNGSK